ncbi:N-acetylmuramoyl-L-alanine amidase [gut metagenome]|uniref:N-acetylmuramoyl-L-alanine amidase n=1 Tax=gut metagenome TaxID=749906 RepID=J9G3J4_9ZZZZ
MNARGWSAYTSKGQTKADQLASCLYHAAEELLPDGIRIRKDTSDGDEDWEEGFYILRKTKCPAVLTENLFQDNREDVIYLTSNEGKNAIIGIHVRGIEQYIKGLK